MVEAKNVITEAAKWPVLKDYRNVLEKFAQVASLDLTDSQNHPQLESMYANYHARLNMFASRLDRPEARVYLKLSKLCNPTVFKDSIYPAVENNHPLILKPATQISHPLYSIARETQALMPGSVYLRDVSGLFKQGELPPNFNPVVIEFNLETKQKQDFTARIPLILLGTPMSDRFVDQNMGIIQRVVDGLKLTEAKVKVEANHMASIFVKSKDLKKVQGEAKILDWPVSFRGAWLDSSIVSTLLGSNSMSEDSTYFESISLSSGDTQKTWQGAGKSALFGALYPSHDVWKYWSFKNTVYQARNIATSNVLRHSLNLAGEILSLQDIRFDSQRNANLAVHIPVLVSAAFSEVVSRGIEIGFAERMGDDAAIQRQRRDEEDRFWSSF